MNSEIATHALPDTDHKLRFLFVALAIFVSDDTILFGTNADTFYQALKFALYGMATVGLFFTLNTKLLSTPEIYGMFAILASILLTSLVNFDSSGGYIYQAWIVLIAYLITKYMPFGSFAKTFRKIISALAFLSIFIYSMAVLYPSIFDIFPVSENSAGVQFVNLYAGSIYKDVGEIRNASIFREPGVFMIYILYALMLEIFLSKTIIKKRLFALLIALATTYSTAGFILLPVLSAAYLFRSSAGVFRAKNAWLFVLPITAVVLSSIQPEIYLSVFSKLSSDSASFGSSLARLASLVVNAEIFVDSPFFGSGLAQYSSLFERYSAVHFGLPLDPAGQSTNSFMALFATYGLLYGMVVVYAFMRVTRNITSVLVAQSLLFLCFALMFSSQDMRYSLLFYILVFYGLQPRPANPCLRP